MSYTPFDKEIENSLLPKSQLLKMRRRKKAVVFSFIACIALFFCLIGCKAFFSGSSPPITCLRRASPDFLGRDKELKNLEKSLLAKRWSFRSEFPLSVRVLWGIGGIGKTELAIKYANDHLENYSLVWRFECADSQLFEKGYRILAERLGIYADEKISFDVIKQKVHTYLEERRFHKPWLLIFDNVEEELTSNDFPFQGGSVLITARENSVRRDFKEHVHISFLSKKDAATLLMNITSEAKSQEVEDLAEALHCYPLILNQVAHYIRETPSVSIARFFKTFQKKKSLLSVPVSKDLQYGFTLENVLDLNLEKLQKEEPLALEWLKLCSCFAPDQIPLKWLEADPLFAGKSDEILRRLQGLALITYDVNSSSFSIHRLLRKVLLECQKVGEETFLHALKSLVLNANYDSNEYGVWKGGGLWFSHALALSSNPTLATINQESLKASLFFKMGQWLNILGDYFTAIEYCDQCLECLSDNKEDNPIFANALNLKGLCQVRTDRFEQGKITLEKAVKEYQRTGRGFTKELSICLAFLCEVFRDLSEYEEAFKMSQEAIAVNKHLGRDDLLARTIQIQAWNYFRLGQGAVAIQESENALAISKEREIKNARVIGWCNHSLGCFYNYEGDVAKGEKYLNLSLKEIEKVYGAGSHITGTIYMNLGESARLKGEYQKGIDLEQIAIDYVWKKRDRLYAFCLSNKGFCKQGLEQFDEALSDHRRALAILVEIFGKKGIDVGRAYKRMGRCLREMGRVEEGLEAQETALKILEELFPNRHPITAASWKERGACLLELGRYKEAVEACQNALNYWGLEGKNEHPQKAKSLQVMAKVYQAMGQSEKAQQLFLEAFLIAHRTYIKSHPELKGYCVDLVNQFEKTQGSLWKARAKEACYPLVKKTMGRWHPITRKMSKA